MWVLCRIPFTLRKAWEKKFGKIMRKLSFYVCYCCCCCWHRRDVMVPLPIFCWYRCFGFSVTAKMNPLDIVSIQTMCCHLSLSRHIMCFFSCLSEISNIHLILSLIFFFIILYTHCVYVCLCACADETKSEVELLYHVTCMPSIQHCPTNNFESLACMRIETTSLFNKTNFPSFVQHPSPLHCLRTYIFISPTRCYLIIVYILPFFG